MRHGAGWARGSPFLSSENSSFTTKHFENSCAYRHTCIVCTYNSACKYIFIGDAQKAMINTCMKWTFFNEFGLEFYISVLHINDRMISRKFTGT